MNTADDLLRRALNYLEYNQDIQLKIDIKNYLAKPKTAPKDEPVAWGQPDACGNIVETITPEDKVNPKAPRGWAAIYSVPLYLHPPKPAEPEAEPVLYIKEQELLYIQVLKQEGLAQEWKSNLGFVKEADDVGLYLHPPKPAEPEAEYDFYGVIPLTHRKAKGIIKDRGYHVTGFVLSRPDGDKCIVDMSAVRWLSGKEFFEMMHPPTKTTKPAPMKPMTREEILAGLEGWDWHPDRDAGFYAGIRFAERHHGIGGGDE